MLVSSTETDFLISSGVLSLVGGVMFKGQYSMEISVSVSFQAKFSKPSSWYITDKS